jgi:hypothetical protein
VSFRNYSPEVIELAADASAAACRRGDHRQRGEPARAQRHGRLRPGRRERPPVPLAGGAPVPRAGARRERRPRARRRPRAPRRRKAA